MDAIDALIQQILASAQGVLGSDILAQLQGLLGGIGM